MTDIIVKLVSLYEAGLFDLSYKAGNFIFSTNYTLADIKYTLNGSIHKKQRDEKKESSYKYTIHGFSCDGTPMYLACKIVNNRLFIITFHTRS